MKTLLNKIKESCIPTLLLSLCVVMAGCSSKPSDGDGKQAIQNQINQDSQGRIKLVEFHKTNGQLAEVNAVKVYSLEFKAEIEFASDCKWITGLGGSMMGFRTAQLPNKSLGALAQFAADDGMPGTIVKQGQQVKISGVIRFEKKENGWSVDGISINSATPIARSVASASEISQTHQPSAIAANVSPASIAVNSESPSKQQTNQEPSLETLKKIRDDLHAIFSAEVNWAVENHKQNSDIPTFDDLKPYWAPCGRPNHPPGGQYILKPLGQDPESSQFGNIEMINAKFHDVLFPKPPVRAFETMTPDQLQNLVINDLRYIDAAKNQWRLEKPLDDLQNNRPITDTSHATPSEDDLKRFLPNQQFPEHPPGGHYIINPVGQSPESSTYGKLP